MRLKYISKSILAFFGVYGCPNCGGGLMCVGYAEVEVCVSCGWNELDGLKHNPETPDGCLYVYQEEAS